MLTHLTIRNYALIESLDMDFFPGLSTITGETGAGKSIILGALGLIQGERADTTAIQHGATTCIVEAEFDIKPYGLEDFFATENLDYQEHTIVRRQLADSGKSRAFINDLPVNLKTLRVFASRVLDIHSQHANLLLQDANFQLHVLDVYAKTDGMMLTYRERYDKWRAAKRTLEKTREQAAKAAEDRDYVSYQLSELTAANLQEGEQEELEQRQKTLTHAQELAAAYGESYVALQGDAVETNILLQLHEAVDKLGRLREADPDAGAAADRIEAAMLDLEDVAKDLSVKFEDMEFDPAEAERVAQRLDTLYHLEKKHRVESVGELIALRDEYTARMELIDDSEGTIRRLEQECAKALATLEEVGKKLREARLQATDRLGNEVEGTLRQLGMPHAHFIVQIAPLDEWGAEGGDSVEFQFTANKNGVLQPLAKVASGGEMSRMMLSLKRIMALGRQLPSIIFDEIDTGVSGEVASKLGDIMEELALRMQVINITHLPQIASCGSHHYRVYKEHGSDQTTTQISLLTDQEREEEIAKMLSGASVTEAALANARELLQARKNRSEELTKSQTKG